MEIYNVQKWVTFFNLSLPLHSPLYPHSVYEAAWSSPVIALLILDSPMEAISSQFILIFLHFPWFPPYSSARTHRNLPFSDIFNSLATSNASIFTTASCKAHRLSFAFSFFFLTLTYVVLIFSYKGSQHCYTHYEDAEVFYYKLSFALFPSCKVGAFLLSHA